MGGRQTRLSFPGDKPVCLSGRQTRLSFLIDKPVCLFPRSLGILGLLGRGSGAALTLPRGRCSCATYALVAGSAPATFLLASSGARPAGLPQVRTSVPSAVALPVCRRSPTDERTCAVCAPGHLVTVQRAGPGQSVGPPSSSI